MFVFLLSFFIHNVNREIPIQTNNPRMLSGYIPVCVDAIVDTNIAGRAIRLGSRYVYVYYMPV
jgi:hypothetical protein